MVVVFFILRCIGVAFCALVSYVVISALRMFFFPRKGTLPESYPLQNTLTCAANQDVNLDITFKWFMAQYEKNKKKSFVLELLFMPPVICTIDVANVTHILKTNFKNYGKESPVFKPKLQGMFGDGIFNCDGQQWYAHRKTSAHLFNLREFKSTVLNTFNHDLTIVIDYMKAKKQNSFDIHALMHKFTLESIAQIAFGLELGCISDNEVQFANDFDFCGVCIADSFVNPFWMIERYCTFNGWKYFACLRRVNDFANKIIKDRRAQVASGATKGRSDLLSLYLDRDSFSKADGSTDDDDENDVVKKSNGGYSDTFMEPTDKNLRDVILNMILAGRDTTAQALSWAFYSLCTHPEVQVKIREEIAAVTAKMGSEAAGGPEGYSYAFLQQLRYTEAVCLETLRLYPSVPKEVKSVMANDVLPDGTEVRKGDIVTFQAYSMGRDPDLWGPDCLEFVPERFLGVGKPNPFVFTAFQAGPRQCLGQNFAMLEMKCALARLLNVFEFTLQQPADSVTYVSTVSMPIKGGLQVTAKLL